MLPDRTTRIRTADAAGITEAAELIRHGYLVAVPTETVYGLAADATNGEAVAAVYAAKGRPDFNPLIVHVATVGAAKKLARFDARACRLAERFWPGPLTLVLPLLDSTPLSSLVTAGLPTVALRIPDHPVMQAVLAAVDRPVAAPSANASGRLSPTRATHVAASLEGRIPLILDAGPTERGLESTIVAVESDGLRLLRPGPITGAELGEPLLPARPGKIEAPGQLASHYAPAKPLRLDAAFAQDDEWLIGFGEIAGHSSLSTAGNLVEAAATLFDRLHEADASPAARIAVAPVPREGLGVAINDRLIRAAVREQDLQANGGR